MENAFCGRCGKPLPPVPGTPPGVGLPPPPPPDDLGGTGDDPLERALTDSERVALKGSSRARHGNMARAFGTFAGIAPLFLIFMGILGTPFEPLNFQIIVIVGGVLAIALGATSLRLRTPISLLLKGGNVTEARGVAEKRPASGGLIGVAFCGFDFLMPARLAARIPDGQMASIAFALVGMARAPRADRARALVLGVNGDAQNPEDAYVAVPPEVAATFRVPTKSGLARGA